MIGLVRGFGFDVDGIAQRSSESFVAYVHPITVSEGDAFAEAQRMRAEEVNVHIAWLAVTCEFEVMMLEIGEAVAHVFLTGLNLLRPDGFFSALDSHFAGDRLERCTDDELRTDAAGAEFRSGEIEIVALFELVVGELIAQWPCRCARACRLRR